jgi:hypothetical protein
MEVDLRVVSVSKCDSKKTMVLILSFHRAQ